MANILAASGALFRDRDLFVHDGKQLRRLRLSGDLQMLLALMLGLLVAFSAYSMVRVFSPAAVATPVATTVSNDISRLASLTEQKIKIIEGHARKDPDSSEATVVLLDMGNEFNNRLRPILEKQLKPGTRIVSHRFVLGDWAPDKSITVTGLDGDEYKLHVWTVKEKKK